MYTTKRILELCWSKYIVNVAVVWPPLFVVDDAVSVYTYFPYARDHCERVLPVLLNRFRDGRFWMNRTMFPVKLENLYKCPIIAATIDFYPYFMISGPNGTEQYSGLDFNVVRELASQLNFSLIIQIPANRNDRGYILENNTVTGVLGMVLRLVLHILFQIISTSFPTKVYYGHANVCMGGLGLNEQRSRLLYPLFYHQTSFVMAGVHGEPFSALEKLYIPFAANTWLATSILLLLATVAITVIKWFSPIYRHFLQGITNNMPFFNMIATFMGVPATRMSSRNFGRYIFVIWLMATMILRNSYHGVLFNILHQNSMHPPPRTIDQLVVQQFMAYINPSTMTFLNGTLKIQSM